MRWICSEGLSLQVSLAPSSGHDSLYVSLARSDLCWREETVRRRLLPIPSRTMASGLPVIGPPDWVTLSRDRTTIQSLDRKLRDASSRCPALRCTHAKIRCAHATVFGNSRGNDLLRVISDYYRLISWTVTFLTQCLKYIGHCNV